ncbi:MAG: helix-turn-helix domain-containing protein [Fimbriiglobus sp.]
MKALSAFLAAGHSLAEAQAAGLCKVTQITASEGAIATRAARNALGLSQPDFAAFLGVSPQTIKAWEQSRKSPTPPVLRMLRHIAVHPKTWSKS